jgi:HAE1 family hydrophobic/amphiphilic exporter-1
MFLSNASIRRPVAMGCLIIALAFLGLNAYRKMGLELLPTVDAPYITVVTIYPGASPQEIETDVAKRIEDAVVAINGLKHVHSVCMENMCQTLLEFEMDVDVDIAATDVREKIDLVRSDLPESAEDPVIQKYDINATPIITLALTGDAPLDELYDYAANDLKDRLTTIPGVAAVELVGGAKREVHVWADRQRLQARGLTTLDIYQAIKRGLGTIPSGRVQDHGSEYTVKFDAEFTDIRDIGQLEIANEAGQRVRIGDVARVEMATEELRRLAAVDGRQCVSIRVVKRGGANALEVTNRVKARLAEIKDNLPGGMELIWVTDDAGFIKATVNNAWSDVAFGIVLTAAILFVFLYNLRTLLVVSITMPLTIVISLFFMHLAGFTLNAATMIAIGMSVGILVANSIVVLEGIIRRLNEGKPPREAAMLGVKQVFAAVLASAGTNAVVLFPLSMMPSKAGLFVKPAALTMVILTLVSLFVSFTLTPMLCALLLKSRDSGKRTILSRIESGWNRGLASLISGYRRFLGFLERHRAMAILVVLATAVLLLHSVSLMKAIGFGLVQKHDPGEVHVKLEFPTRYSLDQTWRRVQDAEARLADLPELRHRLATVGKIEGVIGQSSEGVYLAQILLRFSERDERDITLTELVDMVRTRLHDFPESVVTVSRPLPIGGQISDVEIEISGPSLDVLDRRALETRDLTERIPGLFDVDTTVREGKPELRIRPIRPVLADRGIPALSLGTALRGNLEGLTAGTYKRAARNYDIVVLFDKQEGKDQVAQFEFPGEPGTPVLLKTVASVSETRAPVQIIRADKQRVSKVFATLADNKPLGIAADEISTAIREKGSFPAGYRHRFVNLYEVMEEVQVDLAEAMLIACVLVILSLAAILESFKQAFFILVSVPLTIPGIMWSLYVAGLSLDIFVLMGCVMMVGIVVNNAILIMDQFNVHIAEGVPRHKAMITAACERFRPIVMTTVAAVLGMLPMAISRGIGAELRNSVGVALMGGILVSAVLTLILLPILYDLFTRRNPEHDNATDRVK